MAAAIEVNKQTVKQLLETGKIKSLLFLSIKDRMLGQLIRFRRYLMIL
ncbi:hypothetical protein [Streptococcus anginosus]|nr:hypothetical protein [Streptococcus anginosus]